MSNLKLKLAKNFANELILVNHSLRFVFVFVAACLAHRNLSQFDIT